jgi:hypothetical protein
MAIAGDRGKSLPPLNAALLIQISPTDPHLPLIAALCYFSENITAEKS